MKEQWEELRDMAARQYAQDAKNPAHVGLVEVAQRLKDNNLPTDARFVRNLALSAVMLNNALVEEREKNAKPPKKTRTGKPQHLSYCIMTAALQGPGGHPQKVMKSLGITYQNATPCSVSDTWIFWNCENIPLELPKFLHAPKQGIDPLGWVGGGLSMDEAIAINAYMGTNKDRLDHTDRQHIHDKKNKEVRGMLDKAGMYPRPGIVDRIIAAASYHAQETGRLPATVYLGEKEVGELLAYAQKLKATMGSPVQIEEKVCGYSLVRVKKESYFAVH